MNRTDAINERLEQLQRFLDRLTKIDALEEIVYETRQKIKKLRTANEGILEQLRNRGVDQAGPGSEPALPFQGTAPPPPTGDPDDDEEEEPAPDPDEEDENGEETEDDDIEVDVLIDSEPPAAQPEGGLQ
jgi:hypothetical protein